MHLRKALHSSKSDQLSNLIIGDFGRCQLHQALCLRYTEAVITIVSLFKFSNSTGGEPAVTSAKPITAQPTVYAEFKERAKVKHTAHAEFGKKIIIPIGILVKVSGKESFFVLLSIKTNALKTKTPSVWCIHGFDSFSPQPSVNLQCSPRVAAVQAQASLHYSRKGKKVNEKSEVRTKKVFIDSDEEVKKNPNEELENYKGLKEWMTDSD